MVAVPATATRCSVSARSGMAAHELRTDPPQVRADSFWRNDLDVPAHWGDRFGRVRDPLGNLWWLLTRIEDLTPEQIEARYGQREYIDALKYAQSTDFFA